MDKAIGTYVATEDTTDEMLVWQNQVDPKTDVNPGDDFDKEYVTVFSTTPFYWGGGSQPSGVRA